MWEMKTNSKCEKPTLQKVLDFTGDRMAPAPESVPHANTVVHSTYEGAQPIAEFALETSIDAVTCKSFAKAQTGMETPLPSASGCILPDPPWPKTADCFAVAKKRRYSHRQGQGDSWDQYGDSLSAASALASAKEGGRYGMLGKSERNWNSWGRLLQGMRYDVQPANRGDNPWKGWAKEVRDAQPENKAKSSSSSWHTPASGARDRIDHINGQLQRKDLTASDHDIHRECRRRRMKFSSGWANDPSSSQSKRSKPRRSTG